MCTKIAALAQWCGPSASNLTLRQSARPAAAPSATAADYWANGLCIVVLLLGLDALQVRRALDDHHGKQRWLVCCTQRATTAEALPARSTCHRGARTLTSCSLLVSHAIGGVVRACGTLWKLMAPCVFRVKPRPTVRMGYRLQQLRPWLWQANQG